MDEFLADTLSAQMPSPTFQSAFSPYTDSPSSPAPFGAIMPMSNRCEALFPTRNSMNPPLVVRLLTNRHGAGPRPIKTSSIPLNRPIPPTSTRPLSSRRPPSRLTRLISSRRWARVLRTRSSRLTLRYRVHNLQVPLATNQYVACQACRRNGVLRVLSDHVARVLQLAINTSISRTRSDSEDGPQSVIHAPSGYKSFVSSDPSGKHEYPC